MPTWDSLVPVIADGQVNTTHPSISPGNSRNRMALRQLKDKHHQQGEGIHTHHNVRHEQDLFVVARNPTDLPVDAQFDRERTVAVEKREDVPPLMRTLANSKSSFTQVTDSIHQERQFEVFITEVGFMSAEAVIRR
jgi:hypothetical protein